MMDKQYGDFVIICDGCDAILETKTSNFDAARNQLIRNRWKSTKRDDDADWKHFCPACQYRRHK